MKQEIGCIPEEDEQNTKWVCIDTEGCAQCRRGCPCHIEVWGDTEPKQCVYSGTAKWSNKVNMKTTQEKIVQVRDWDATVEETYNRPYSFQQQDGCKSRGIFRIRVPDEAEDFEQDAVPEEVNHDDMGVSFSAWLKRDTEQKLESDDPDYKLRLWWERNFYPDVQMVANDMCKKGVIEPGDYVIDIDW